MNSNWYIKPKKEYDPCGDNEVCQNYIHCKEIMRNISVDSKDFTKGYLKFQQTLSCNGS